MTEIWTSGVKRITFAAPTTAAEEWDLYTRGPRFESTYNIYHLGGLIHYLTVDGFPANKVKKNMNLMLTYMGLGGIITLSPPQNFHLNPIERDSSTFAMPGWYLSLLFYRHDVQNFSSKKCDERRLKYYVYTFDIVIDMPTLHSAIEIPPSSKERSLAPIACKPSGAHL